MKCHKEQLEDICERLEGRNTDFPSAWIIKGLIILKRSSVLDYQQKAYYRAKLSEYIVEYYGKR
jgi:hypothetical protein